MNDPNITMEEYIMLEEEKAHKYGKVFNWEAARYGKIWYDDDIDDLRSVETEFPAIVFNDNLKSEETLSCEPTISSLHNKEIDFTISFDESDDEDYTSITEGITRRRSLIVDKARSKKSDEEEVLYKVEDIATCLVEYVKLRDDWEVDR
ncbi:hypothetical protein Tco_1361416 [Tanacetum coccineum]